MFFSLSLSIALSYSFYSRELRTVTDQKDPLLDLVEDDRGSLGDPVIQDGPDS